MDAWVQTLPLWALLLLGVAIYGGIHLAQNWMRTLGQRHRGTFLEREGKPLPYAGTLAGLLLLALGLPMAYYFIYMPYQAIKAQAPDVTYSMKGAMFAMLFIFMGIFFILGNNWYVENYAALKALRREEYAKHWMFKFFVLVMVIILAGSHYAMDRYLKAHGYHVTYDYELEKAEHTR